MGVGRNGKGKGNRNGSGGGQGPEDSLAVDFSPVRRRQRAR